MNEVQIFNNDAFGKVRVIRIDGEIWFIGRDVAIALRHNNPNVAMKNYCKHIVKRHIPEIHKVSSMVVNTIQHMDVIRLANNAPRRERADDFIEWINEYVFPAVNGEEKTSPVVDDPEKTEVKDIVAIEWKGERVLTTEQLAAVYGCSVNNIRVNFKNNSSRFKASRHFYRLEGSDIKGLAYYIKNFNVVDAHAPSLYLWTKRGALRHCKMLGTDTAWDVFDELEDTYFNVHDKKNSLPMPNFSNPAEAARAWANEYEKRVSAELQTAQMQQIVQEMKPKADYTDVILKSKNEVTITQIAKDYGKSGQWLNKFLHRHNVQYCQNGQWLLYKQHQDKGYTHSDTCSFTYKDGTNGSAIHTKWTQKGRLFIHQILESEGIRPLMET